MAKKKPKTKKKKVSKKKVSEAKVKRISKKKQIEHENKILRNFFIGVGIVILLILGFWFSVQNITNFEYKGVDFEVVKSGDLVFYRTDFPTILDGQKVNYNIYIRNDPRKLENKVDFNGEWDLQKIVVINTTNDFNCEGYGIIAIENFKKQSIFGREFYKDPEAGCDAQGRYTFINIQESDETSIKQTGASCYEFNVNNCEIIDVTERFMIETFINANKALKN